jgi:hypothetical protein
VAGAVPEEGRSGAVPEAGAVPETLCHRHASSQWSGRDYLARQGSPLLSGVDLDFWRRRRAAGSRAPHPLIFHSPGVVERKGGPLQFEILCASGPLHPPTVPQPRARGRRCCDL